MRPAAAALAAVLLAGCAAEAVAPLPASAFEGVVWRLETLRGEPAAAEATLYAEDGRLRGRGPCSRYVGAFDRDGSRLSIGPVAAARAACPRSAEETAWFAALTETASHTLGDGRLTLLDEGGGSLMTFERWSAE